MKLQEVCEVYSGYALKEFHDSDEGYPVIKIGNICSDGTLDLEKCQFTNDFVNDKYYSKKGDIYVALSGATTGKIGIINTDDKYIINQRVGIVRKMDKEISDQYIKYFLMNKTEKILEDASGCAQPNISPKQIGQYEFPKIDYFEMNQISDILDKVSSVITQRKLELQKLDDLIKARFVELFGNPEQNEKGWKICRLGDECTVINGRAYKAEELLDEGKYRVLRVGNFFTNDSWYYSDLELDKDKYCDDGDLLFAWSASFGPRIWHGEKVIYHYHIWKLIGYEECLNKDFFVELLNYNCDVMKRGTHGSTMLHFTKSQMEEQKLILPPMEMQEQFADFVKQVDKSKFKELCYNNFEKKTPLDIFLRND